MDKDDKDFWDEVTRGRTHTQAEQAPPHLAAAPESQQPALPEPLRHVWPEDDDCTFKCHYTPAGPGGIYGPPSADGRQSFPIFTAEQMHAYGAACVVAHVARKTGQQPEIVAWRYQRDSSARPGVGDGEWHFMPHGKEALQLQGKAGYSPNNSYHNWEPLAAPSSQDVSAPTDQTATADDEVKKWRALYEAQKQLFAIQQSRLDRAERCGLPAPTGQGRNAPSEAKSGEDGYVCPAGKAQALAAPSPEPAAPSGQKDYCAPPSTGECSCRKFFADPNDCGNGVPK